jgi:hypothetical protein
LTRRDLFRDMLALARRAAEAARAPARAAEKRDGSGRGRVADDPAAALLDLKLEGGS